MAGSLKRAIALVAIGLVVIVPGVLIATGVESFPGREVGARGAADRGLGNQVNVSATQAGIVFQVLDMIADDSYTVVSYTLRGRESEGNTALSASPPQLIDANGTAHRLIRGSIDQADRRRGTWVFPAIPALRGSITVVIDGLELATPTQGESLMVTKVDGQWRSRFAWDGRKSPPGPVVSAPSAVTGLGRGSVCVTSIRLSATGTMLTGTLDGFLAEVIQAMGCPATELEQSGGLLVPWIACRLGIGDGSQGFEITYPPVAGSVKFRFQVTLPSRPGQGALAPGQRVDEGARASLDIVVPKR